MGTHKEKEKNTESVHGWDSFIALQTGELMTTNGYSNGKQLPVKQA